MTPRAVFLDRDGVLNEAVVDGEGVPHPPASPAELRLEPGAAAACARLREAGFLLIAVTNQPDVARGSTPLEDVERVNDAVRQAVGLDDVFVCTHDDGDGCDCRKPLPGLLLRAGERWGIDLGASVLVGDRWRDIEAGSAAGCRTVLIDRPWSGDSRVPPDHVSPDLLTASNWIIDHAKPRRETS